MTTRAIGIRVGEHPVRAIDDGESNANGRKVASVFIDADNRVVIVEASAATAGLPTESAPGAAAFDETKGRTVFRNAANDGWDDPQATAGGAFGSASISTSGACSFGATTCASARVSNCNAFGVAHFDADGDLSSSLLVNADVDAAAAIAGTKVTPDFGSQNIASTGYISIGATPATAGNGIRGGNGFQFYLMSQAGTPRAIMELTNLSASRFTLDICGTAAAVAGVRLFGNGAVIVETGSNTTSLGFFGTAPTTKPTVTGSRGGNAALASLLTALAGLGLIVDSSS